MKLADELFAFRGFQGTPARCRVRVFLPEDDGGAAAYVVIATDDASAEGTSITNAAETLAAEVCLRWNLPPERLTWIEHYDYRHREGGKSALGDHPERFDRVFFSGTKLMLLAGKLAPSLGEPTWRPTDRTSVEELIGEPLA